SSTTTRPGRRGTVSHSWNRRRRSWKRSSGGGAAGGAREGDRPPRPRAGQRADRRRRHGPGDRLRTGPAGRGRQRPDPDRGGGGHAVVHGSGAGRGEKERRTGGGWVLPGGHSVRMLDRPAAVPSGDSDRHADAGGGR